MADVTPRRAYREAATRYLIVAGSMIVLMGNSTSACLGICAAVLLAVCLASAGLLLSKRARRDVAPIDPEGANVNYEDPDYIHPTELRNRAATGESVPVASSRPVVYWVPAESGFDRPGFSFSDHPGGFSITGCRRHA